MNDPTVTLAVVGAGGRGTAYATWALEHPDRARVVAVAERREVARRKMAATHAIAESACYADWRELLDAGRIADAVLICTQDRQHLEPAVAFAQAGWNVLLEKPIAVTPEDCVTIAQAAKRGEGIFAICHVMRYTPYTQVLRGLVETGRLGQIQSMQHLEPIGYWHFAHSYVRGPWRREDASTSMLMAKSCHDLDWMRYVVGRPFTRVQSFGSLSHFRPENRPAGASDRCATCAVAPDCPFEAHRVYHRRLDLRTWPVHHVIDTWQPEDLDEALATGPYGQCVYACDNDVVDQQIVNIEFEGGVTGSFTVNAFNPLSDRKTRIFGSRGWLEGDGRIIRLFDFLTEAWETIEVEAPGDSTAGGGHAGGDAGLADAFVHAVATGDRSSIRSGIDESLASHMAVFAAERSRRCGTVEVVALP